MAQQTTSCGGLYCVYLLFAYIGPLSPTTWGYESFTLAKNLFLGKRSFTCVQKTILITMERVGGGVGNQANPEAFKRIVVAKEIGSTVNTI